MSEFTNYCPDKLNLSTSFLGLGKDMETVDLEYDPSKGCFLLIDEYFESAEIPLDLVEKI